MAKNMSAMPVSVASNDTPSGPNSLEAAAQRR